MGHEPRSIFTAVPSGRMRGMLSVSPPPVMWARPLITPLIEQTFERLQVTDVRQQQRFARSHSQLRQLRVQVHNPRLRKTVCARASSRSCANPAEGNASKTSPGRDRFAVDDLRAIDNADDESRDVVFTLL